MADLNLSDVQVIRFLLGKEEYGIPIDQVKEIIRVPQITQLPQGEAHVEGVINLRGAIVPVVNMRKRLGMGDENGEDMRIVVLDLGDKSVGLMVDAVSEVSRVTRESLQPVPDAAMGREDGWVQGIVKDEDRLIILIDGGMLVH